MVASCSHCDSQGFSEALHKMTYPVQRWDGYEALIYRALQSGKKEEAVRIYQTEAIVDLFGAVHEKIVRSGEGRNNINVKYAGSSAIESLIAVCREKSKVVWPMRGCHLPSLELKYRMAAH